MPFQMWRDNRSPSIADTIRIDGLPVNITGASVKLQARPVGSAALKIDAAATVVSAVSGSVRYDWTAADVDTVGLFDAWWRVTVGGKDQDTPEFELEIVEHAPASSVVPSPVATDGSGVTTIYKGDAYLNTYGRALTYQLQVTDAPDLTGLTVKWRVENLLVKTMTVVGEDAVYVDLTSAETSALTVGVKQFEIEATLTTGEVATLLRSSLIVNPDMT